MYIHRQLNLQLYLIVYSCAMQAHDTQQSGFTWLPIHCGRRNYSMPWCVQALYTAFALYIHIIGSFIVACCSWLSYHSDSVVNPPVTCDDAVTVHLHSHWAKTWWVVQHPSVVPVPPVKQGCCLLPCRGRGQCQSRSRRGGTTNKGGGGGGGRECNLQCLLIAERLRGVLAYAHICSYRIVHFHTI